MQGNFYNIVTFLNFVTDVISHAVALALLWLTFDTILYPVWLFDMLVKV